MRRALDFTLLALAGLMCPRPAVAQPEKDRCASTAESAQDARAHGRLVTAREELLACARPSCPTIVRSDCIRWLGEIETLTPTIIVRARDRAGRDVVAAKVILDGATIREKLDGSPIAVDPGPHVVVCEGAGGRSEPLDVLAIQGERNRVVDVMLPSAAPPASPPPATPTPPATAETSHPPSSTDQGSPLAAYVVGGIGLVALGTFATLEIVGQGDYRRMEHGCATTHTCSASEVDSARHVFIGAGIALGVGALALGGAGILFWIHGSERHAAEKHGAEVRVVPTTAGAAANVSMSF